MKIEEIKDIKLDLLALIYDISKLEKRTCHEKKLSNISAMLRISKNMLTKCKYEIVEIIDGIENESSKRSEHI